MKGLTFGVLAAAIILAGPATAQDYDHDADTQTQAHIDDETVTGVVVSSTIDQLVIRTDTGREMTFVVDSATTLPAGTLNPGSSITVDYRLDADNNYDAIIVRTGTTGLDRGAYREDQADPAASADPATGALDADRADLPATSSPMPLIGLLSLGALAGSLGARYWRKS
jgi:hypothetical protein